MPIKKKVLIVVLALVLIGVGILHVNYPLPYVARVMIDQGPDYDDFETFPASVILPADAPNPIPAEPDARVIALLESYPGVGNVDDFVASTETSALLVVRQGKLVLERHGLGHDGNSIENSFSVSKAVTSMLVGMAAEDGVLRLDAPITDSLPELRERDQRFEAITVENLLDMVSGIAYSREIRFPVINNDDPLVYYHPDLASVVLERTEIAEPPGEFRYNNYNTPLLGLILQRTTGRSVSEYLEQRIWKPIGSSAAAGWTTDQQGFERMESGFHARALDLARLGLLYLDRGRVGDRQVVPESWVLASTDTKAKIELEEYDGRRWGYRAGWWIVPRPEGPSDYAAIGHFGQFIYVSPQYDTVIVRNGPGRGEWGDRDWTALFYFLAEGMPGLRRSSTP
ncbi:MAG: serine hydrolase [Woeseiaceae bacterium]|nr:serine hydrolase [Woeseiaceae bacterium]